MFLCIKTHAHIGLWPNGDRLSLWNVGYTDRCCPKSWKTPATTRNSSEDAIPEPDVFIYDDIVHVLQNTQKEEKQTVKQSLNIVHDKVHDAVVYTSSKILKIG